jgi:uncharacterized protein (DUF2147 family)
VPSSAFMDRYFGCLAVAIVALLVGAPAPARAQDVVGTWLTQAGEGRIRVAKCGGSVCGTVVWIKDPIDAHTGLPPVDEKNPDPGKRNRKILGLRIFAMTPDGQGNWAGGIYNADDGQTYQGKIRLRSANQLEVQGCAGIFCGSEVWSLFGR